MVVWIVLTDGGAMVHSGVQFSGSRGCVNIYPFSHRAWARLRSRGFSLTFVGSVNGLESLGHIVFGL